MTNIIIKSKGMYIKLHKKIKDKSGEGYVDTGVKILISVVLGGLLLAGLYALFNTTIMPTITTKITEMFNYNGGTP